MTHLLRATAALVLFATSIQAQARESPWMPSLGGGQIEWRDIGVSTSARGPGGATAIVMRGSRDVIGRLVGFEWGAAYAAFDEESRLDPTQTIAIDWRLLVHTPWRRIQPFVGAGPSIFMYATNSSGRDKFEGAYNAGGGVRVQVTPGFVLIFDARLRGWEFERSGLETRNDAEEITLSLGFRR